MTRLETKDELLAISRSSNLIRAMLDELNPNNDKAVLNLSLGDPTAFGGAFAAFPAFTRALIRAASTHSGYTAATGCPAAKQAIASKYQVDAADVIVTAGCSVALDFTLRCLAAPGDIVLVPVPGFPLYETLLKINRVRVVRYELCAENGWRVDCGAKFDALVPSHEAHLVKAVVVCNPSNPTGSVYDLEHLEDIVSAVKRNFFNAVLVADQIYEDVVFASTFHDLGPIGRRLGVPAVTLSGLSKGFHCPGWRMGWVVLFDNAPARLAEFKHRVYNLAGTNMGASTGIQYAAAQCITTNANEFAEFRSKSNALLAHSAQTFADGLLKAKGGGVDMCVPQGAMYLFFRFRGALRSRSSFDVCKLLMSTQSLLLLPGDACFNSPQGYLRAFIAIPEEAAVEAVRKLLQFAEEYC